MPQHTYNPSFPVSKRLRALVFAVLGTYILLVSVFVPSKTASASTIYSQITDSSAYTSNISTYSRTFTSFVPSTTIATGTVISLGFTVNVPSASLACGNSNGTNWLSMTIEDATNVPIFSSGYGTTTTPTAGLDINYVFVKTSTKALYAGKTYHFSVSMNCTSTYKLVSGSGGTSLYGSVYTGVGGYFGDTSTRIISVTPLDGQLIATTSSTGAVVNFGMEAYINPADIGSWFGVSFSLHNIDQNVLLIGALSPSDVVFLNRFQATTSGMFYYATSTFIGTGNYRIKADLFNTYLGISSLVTRQSFVNQFIVGTPTFIGNISQNSYRQVRELFATSSATTTQALAGSCVPFSGSFDTLTCLAFLFVPDGALINNSIGNFKDNVLTHFPLGYFSDFYGIISTTSAKTLPLVDAIVPSGVPGAGSRFQVAITPDSLSWLWNATSSMFSSGSATSTGTLYDVTSGYWNIIVYLCVAFYISRRLLGSSLIPEWNHFGKEGALSDNGSHDDSYKLKEWFNRHDTDKDKLNRWLKDNQ